MFPRDTMMSGRPFRRRRGNLGVPLPHGVGPFFAKGGKAASLVLERVSSLLRPHLALIDSVNLKQLMFDLALRWRDWAFAIPVDDRCPDHVAHVGVAAIDDMTPGVGCLLWWYGGFGRGCRRLNMWR